MSWRTQIGKLRSILSGRKRAVELEEEIVSHLGFEERENLDTGISPDEAHYAALRRFGNVMLTEERSRDMWTWSSLEELLQDVRYGLRMLGRARIHGRRRVYAGFGHRRHHPDLRRAECHPVAPLPFRDPTQLRMIWSIGARTGGFGHASIPDYFDGKAQVSVFSDLAAYREANPAEIVASNQHFRTRAVAASGRVGYARAGGAGRGRCPAARPRDGGCARCTFCRERDAFGRLRVPAGSRARSFARRSAAID